MLIPDSICLELCWYRELSGYWHGPVHYGSPPWIWKGLGAFKDVTMWCWLHDHGLQGVWSEISLNLHLVCPAEHGIQPVAIGGGFAGLEPANPDHQSHYRVWTSSHPTETAILLQDFWTHFSGHENLIFFHCSLWLFCLVLGVLPLIPVTAETFW